MKKLQAEVATLNQNSDRQSGEIQSLTEELNTPDAKVTKLQQG